MWQRRMVGAALSALLTAVVAAGLFTSAHADSPLNPFNDIPWTAVTEDASGVEAAFNFARRQEEQQLGLNPGRLGQLDLPEQTEWNLKTDAEKAFFLMNAERVARAGTGARVLGLGFTAIQNDVQALAQDYANLLVNRNQFTHVMDNRDPFDRIAEHPVLGPCSEFLSRAENLALLGTSGDDIPLYLERAIFAWLYSDAGSNWGHRETILLQDRDLSNGDPDFGFKNNVGEQTNEGYIGIGVVETDGHYNPFDWQDLHYSVVIVMEMIDPSPAAGCPWPAALPPTPTPQPTPTAASPPPSLDFHAFLPIAKS
jgi:uncharacterized protein YkwD